MKKLNFWALAILCSVQVSNAQSIEVAEIYNETINSSDTPALIFSEYLEGSGNNKAMEIYNASDTGINLSDYRIASATNGNGWSEYRHFEDAILASGDTYVIITDQFDPVLFDPANADEVLAFPSLVHFNGDDARAIIHINGTDTTVVDLFGDPDSDPGAGWEVAGIADATSEHTLIRKSTITSGNPFPLASFGTDEASSEWILLNQNDASDLGTHTGSTDNGGEIVNILINGDFSTNSDWNFEVLNGASGVTGSIENGELFFTGLPESGAPWEIQANQNFSQEQIEMIFEGGYEVSFDARTSVGTKDINIFLGEFGGSWTTYFTDGEGTVTVDTEMSRYSLVTFIDQTFPEMRIGIEVNTPGTDIYIDNLVFNRLPDVEIGIPEFNASANNGEVTITVVDDGAATYDVFYADSSISSIDDGRLVGTIDPMNGLTFSHRILAPHPSLVTNVSAHFGVVARDENGAPSDMATTSLNVTTGVREHYIAGLDETSAREILTAVSDNQMPDNLTLRNYFPNGYSPFQIHPTTSVSVIGSGADNEADLSGQFWVGFETTSDTDFLIIYSEINDDILRFPDNFGSEAGGSGWNYDSWEISIGAYEPASVYDGSDHQDLEIGSEPDYQLRGGFFSDNTSYIFGYNGNNGFINQLVPNSATIGEITDTGYRLLTVVSANDLTALQSENANFTFPVGNGITTVPFNIMLNDNDDQNREHLLGWSPKTTDFSWRNPSEWETVAFVGEDGVQNSEDPVNVTFIVNTSTLPDTLQEYHTVQLRGDVFGPDIANAGLGDLISWDTNSLLMNNVGGDYWSVEFAMSPGDTMNYKFFAGTDPFNGMFNGAETGWESGGNNQFVLPAVVSPDTLIPVQWFETREAPFDSHQDSISVFFRVNVGKQAQTGIFNPETDQVGVRGNPEFFPNPADWSTTVFVLEQEQVNNDANLFYSGSLKISRSDLNSLPDVNRYKFVFDHGDGSVTWESGDDKLLSVPANDSTIHWRFFNDEAPSTSIINTELQFEVNVQILEGLGFFDFSLDSVFARGSFNGWGDSTPLSYNEISGTHISERVPYTEEVGEELPYKFYVRWDERRDDPNSEFYLPGIRSNESGWEEPGATGGGDRKLKLLNLPQQPTASHFYNDVAPQGLINESNVQGGSGTVTFRINMEPATTRDDGVEPFNPLTDDVYLVFETPLFMITNGLIERGTPFSEWSSEYKDEVRLIDENGDFIYELEFPLQFPTLNSIGFVVGYESQNDGGNFIINGGGFNAGRRYQQYIQPIIDPNLNVSWPSTFEFPVLDWKASDLEYELPPDYSVPNVDGVGPPELEINSFIGLINETEILRLELISHGEAPLQGMELTLNYDPSAVSISLGDQTGTLVENIDLVSNDLGDQFIVSFATNGLDNDINRNGTLMNFNLELLSAGETEVIISDISINEIPHQDLIADINIVPRLCGDVSGDDLVSALDASFVLQHTVKIADVFPLIGLDSIAADVTGNGDISAFDASWILQRTVGVRDNLGCISLPLKEEPKPAIANWTLKSTENGNNEVELNFGRTEFEIYAIQLELEGGDEVTFKRITNLPEAWNMVSNTTEGVTHLSLYGTNPIDQNALNMEFSTSTNGALPKLKGQVSLNETVVPEMDDLLLGDVPSEFALNQNYPNPFNPSTNISYTLPEMSQVDLTIYNMLGQKVATLVNQTQEAGSYTISWEAGNASSGVYIYRLTAGDQTFTKRMMLIK